MEAWLEKHGINLAWEAKTELFKALAMEKEGAKRNRNMLYHAVSSAVAVYFTRRYLRREKRRVAQYLAAGGTIR